MISGKTRIHNGWAAWLLLLEKYVTVEGASEDVIIAEWLTIECGTLGDDVVPISIVAEFPAIFRLVEPFDGALPFCFRSGIANDYPVGGDFQRVCLVLPIRLFAWIPRTVDFVSAYDVGFTRFGGFE